jgi:hypothetical protein
MSFERLLVTAQDFWNVLENFCDVPENLPPFSRDTEKTRFLCLLGFTSLDAQLNAYWASRALPEWQEIVSLIHATLDDEKTLNRLLDVDGHDLTRTQLIASLRFFTELDSPEKFSPSGIDCALLWLLLGDLENQNEDYFRVAKIIFQLAKIRASCFQTTRDFNELKGREAIILFHRLRDFAPAHSPAFLGETVPSNMQHIKAA